MESSPRVNLLLRALPADVYQRIAPELEPADLPHGRTIVPASGVLDRFYFITSGLVSLIYETGDGESAELAIVGYEGGIGMPLLLGDRPFPAQAVVQMPATAWTLRPEIVRREFEHVPVFRRAILLYVQALMTQMALTVVCNRHHSVVLQLCRWILLSIDRLPDSDLYMTQEMIARMLGVRRAGVTEALAQLNNAGLIERRRGQITVCDRSGLEQRACECYGMIKQEYGYLELDLLEKGIEAVPGG